MASASDNILGWETLPERGTFEDGILNFGGYYDPTVIVKQYKQYGMQHESFESVIEEKLRKMLDTKGLNPDDVETLLINNDQLAGIPSIIQDSFEKTLACLDVRENELTKLPNTIRKLTELWVLLLGENKIRTLPDDFGVVFGQLRYLDLRGNQLKSLPESFGDLHNLERLQLDRNQLKSLPSQLPVSLKNLSMSGNRTLERFPESLSLCVNLERLAMADCNLDSVPESCNSLTKMQIVNFMNNKLSLFPECMKSWVLVERMDLSNNKLHVLPDWFPSVYTKLVALFLDSNRFERLPDDLGNLSELRQLSLLNNKELKYLPPSLQNKRIDDLAVDSHLYADGHMPHYYVGKALGNVLGERPEQTDHNNTSDVVISYRRMHRTKETKLRPIGCSQM